MRAAVDARKAADRAKAAPHDELKAYLDAPLEPVSDVIAWWGVCYVSERLKQQLITVKETCCAVPCSRSYGERLSRNPRVRYTVRMCLLEWLSH